MKNCGLLRRFYHIMGAMERRYIRMVERMAELDKTKAGEWSVYILRCRGNRLYTGIAKDVKARFNKHKSGKGAAFTRINPPQALLYQENGFSRSAALVREAAIKRLPAASKRELTKSQKKTPSRKAGKGSAKKKKSS
jgi:putative endonuclease